MAFKLERIDKHPTPPAAWTIRGLAVHNTAQAWEESGRTSDWRADYARFYAEEEAKAKTRWPDLDTWIKTPRVKSTETDIKLRQADGFAQIEKYIARATADADLWEPYHLPDGRLGIELKFELDVGSPDFIIFGYIDLLQHWKSNGTVTVTDIKTGGDDRENRRQLGIYSLAARECFGIPVTHGQYWYTKLDRGSGWINLDQYTRLYVLEEFTKLDQGIESGIFLANPKKGICEKFCGVRQYCPEMRDQ